jgi:hypothetical protein
MVEAGEKHGDARSFADFQAGSQAFQPVGAAPDASADAGVSNPHGQGYITFRGTRADPVSIL